MRDPVQDRKTTADVSSHLATRGIRAPCRVAVNTTDGDVTLTGKVQYEHQKNLAVQVTRGLQHVRRVIDQITVMPRVDARKPPPGYTPGQTH